ncbi:DUF6325 family protein [Streptomyces sp. NPDC006553]|uniref:DUF6325 family protein n=1 Tax=Streptomyces sp. NPDC006553 TaxID=3157180 RepID=UPI00339E9AE2
MEAAYRTRGLSAIGPVECVVLAFPGERLRVAAVTALADLRRAGQVRLVDSLVEVKSAGGEGVHLRTRRVRGVRRGHRRDRPRGEPARPRGDPARPRGRRGGGRDPRTRLVRPDAARRTRLGRPCRRSDPRGRRPYRGDRAGAARVRPAAQDTHPRGRGRAVAERS